MKSTGHVSDSADSPHRTFRPQHLTPAYGGAQHYRQWGWHFAALLLGLIFAVGSAAPPADAAGRTLRLVVLGDSLSAGFRLPGDAAFPVVLEKALRARGYMIEVANAAISGDTATGGFERLGWAMGGPADAMILELGANDMLRGLDPEVTRRALNSILEQVALRNVRVLIAGMRASPSLGADYKARFDSIYPDLAKKHDAILYPFFLEGVAADPALNLSDGMHPNRAGVERIVQGILPSVEALIKQAQ